MRRWLLLAICLLFPALSAAESAPLPLVECTTVEDVIERLLMPDDAGDGTYQPVETQAGYIRYISQNSARDPAFCPDYWIADTPGSELDLTLEYRPDGKPYAYYSGNMCTRAVYSMAMSYLGLDCSPGGMSLQLDSRDLTEPYDKTTALLDGVERVKFKKNAFVQMFEQYIADSRFSPVYIYLRKPNGRYHALLVVAREEDGRYLVVDPSVHLVNGKPVYVYAIRFDKVYRTIINGTFAREYKGSLLLSCHQWRLTDVSSAP